jgi:antitoxin CptB
MDDSASIVRDINRLRWRCRRGTRELDQLLSGWLTERYEKSDSALRAAFASMLDLPDPDLWDWLTGNSRPADARFARIVDEIRARHRV